MVSLERSPFRDFTAEEFLGGYLLGLVPKRRRLKCPALVVAEVSCASQDTSATPRRRVLQRLTQPGVTQRWRCAGEHRPAEHAASLRSRHSPVASGPRRLPSMCTPAHESPPPVRLRLIDVVASQLLAAALAEGYRVGRRVSGVRSREALTGTPPPRRVGGNGGWLFCQRQII